MRIIVLRSWPRNEAENIRLKRHSSRRLGCCTEHASHSSPPGTTNNDTGHAPFVVLWLPPTLTVAGVAWQVVPNAVSPTSVGAAHPSIDASGLHGDYALTSIGAVVNWHHLLAMGNLLWRLGPGRILAFFVIPAVAA